MSKCILEIRDEVNIRLNGLDAGLRRKIGDKLKFFLPQAYHMPSYKLGRWDGCVRFFDVGGRSYFHLLEEILPLVIEAGYEIDVDDSRKTFDFNFQHVDSDTYSDVKWPKGHPAEGQSIVLRDYQVAAVNNFLDNPQSLQQIATGAGKTLITAALSERCEHLGRTIVIVPNKDLVTQTEKDYRNMGLDVGVLYGDRKEYDKTHTICTWQSLEVLRKKSKLSEAPMDIEVFLDDVVCIMVDECFAPGTKVLTPCGYVPIETLREGDRVVNYSEQTGEFKEDVVVKLHENLPKSDSEDMYELEFNNGSVVRVTGNHMFRTTRGWVRADQITEDDEIMSYDK